MKGRNIWIIAAIVIFASIFSMTAFIAASGDSNAEPTEVDVDSMGELASEMIGATSDIRINLTSDFADDLYVNGAVQITINHNNNITILCADPLKAKSGGLHFDIVNNGNGTIRFENVKLANTDGYSNTGGMQLNGGNWEFSNCTFSGLTKAAVTFAGNRNDASFIDCTFSDNSNRAMVLAGGQIGNIATYDFKNCLFRGNSITGTSGGGAIYVWNSNFSINVDGCVFADNKAIGTSTASGGNNRVDGGAMYVNASYGQNCSLNVFNTYFEKNFAQDDGGAILVEGSQTYTSIRSNIANCTFYGNTAAGAWYGNSLMKITDGCGGAICYFGLTESKITHCTFYNNGITNALSQGVSGSSSGSVGGGGAVGVDTGDSGSGLASLPPMPKLTNNIFVGNYVTKPASQSTINLINSLTGNGLGNITERSKTGNIFVLPACDADFQGALQGMDPRLFENNGNIGYDNGSWSSPNNYTNDGIDPSGGVVVKNVFANYNNTANRGDPNTAISTQYGNPVGASGSDVYKKCFIPSPTSNELYRGDSAPYVVEVPYDALGNMRDTFPNAGAVEIYWTMFNPGANADWTNEVPTYIENPDDPGNTYPVIKSLNFGTNNSYYVMTDIGIWDSPSGNTIAMPRSAIYPFDPTYGFLGWRSNLPDLNWSGYAQWASDNGYAETTVEGFLQNNPASDLPLDAFPLYQPGDVILSTKQTLTAEWYQYEHRVDFDLNYGNTPNWYNSSEPGRETPRLSVALGSTITAPLDPMRADYSFRGWYKDAACTQAWDFGTDTVTTDIVLYAGWELISYSVIYHSDGASSGSAPVDGNSPYPDGSTVVVLGKGTMSRTNFTFSGWSTSLEGPLVYKAGDTFMITADVDLYPVWQYVSIGGGKGTFYIYPSADGGSSITPSVTVSVTEGGSATFTFHALSGYRIKSVMIDGTEHPELVNAGSYTFSNVTEDHSIAIVSTDSASIGDKDTTKEGGSGEGNWSILNLICAVIALITGIIAVAAGRKRSAGNEDDIENPSKLAAALRVLGLILGIASIIIFFLTEDMTMQPILIDKWTLLMFILLLVTVFASVAGFGFNKEREREKNSER